MGVHKLQRWAASHFCYISSFKISYRASCVRLLVVVIALCGVVVVPIESLDLGTSSPVETGFLKGFLRINDTSSVSSSTLSSLFEDKLVPPTPPISRDSNVPMSTTPSPRRVGKKTAKSRESSSSELVFFESDEDRKRIMKVIPESLFAQRFSEEGRKEMRDRARFLVGSLSRQNCFSKVICGLGARPPSTKTDLLNDYVYLMNDLLVDDDKSGEEGKAVAASSNKLRDDSDTSSAQEMGKSKDKGKRPIVKNDYEDDLPISDDDYNPVLAQMAEEELVGDDPAILKFMQVEMKRKLKNRPPPGPPPPPYYMRHRPRFRRDVGNNETTAKSDTEGRSSSRSEAQRRFKETGRFFRDPPMNYVDASQFISKRRLQLKNEKDFKKKLSLAADAGRTLRNRRQCRLLFDDCPLDESQIDTLVVGLKRVMEAGNLAAVLPPRTTLAPQAQAVVDAVKKTVASTQATHTAAPGSKVEIILHLNQNGMPYQNQGGSYPATAYLHPGQLGNISAATPSQIPPPPLPYIPPSMGVPQMVPAYHQPEMFTTTTTTPRPVAEEQLLDFLYGVVNFNSTSEAPLLDFDWEGTGSSPVKPLKDRRKRPTPMDISEYLETPLNVRNKVKDEEKVYVRDPIFDNSGEDNTQKNKNVLATAIAEGANDKEELAALKDYLASLKETLVGIAQMNNATLAGESTLFGKSSEENDYESKESDIEDPTKESNSDYFEISTGPEKPKDSDEDEEDDDLEGEDKVVLLKVKGASKKKKGNKKNEGKESTTTQRYDLPQDDEQENETDDENEDAKPSKAPPKKKKRPTKRPAPGKLKTTKKKRKKKPADDEDEEKEVDVEDIINSDEEDEEYGDGEEEDDDEDEKEEEYDDTREEEQEEEADEEDEDEGRSKDKDKVTKPNTGSPSTSPKKPDPTKLTLIFAPSGTGSDKVGDLKGDDYMTSAEKRKLATLTEVLLPTAPAPPPLRPKKPVEDPDDKPVVPAAPPLHREFQKVASFVNDTEIVNMSDFDEGKPTHPKFHKTTKKRPSYRNPAAKKKKAQAIAQAQAAQKRRPVGRPVGSLPYFRPPLPPQRPTPGESSKEDAQDDVGTSTEGDQGGSSEEQEGEEEEGTQEVEGDDEEGSRSREVEDEEYDDEPEDDEKAGDAKKPENNDSEAMEDGDEDKQAEIEFGPGRVPLPGPGPPGIGRLPPRSRDEMDEGKQTSEEHGQQMTKTLIAVPYFREGTETQYVQGPPPPGGGATGQNLFGKFFVNVMGMKQSTTEHPQGNSQEYPPYFGIPPQARNRPKPYSVSYEDRDASPDVKAVEKMDTPASKNETESKPTKLDVAASVGATNSKEIVPPKEFKATINVNMLKGETNDDELDDSPAYDIDEVQDDKGKKKGKKKGKDKEKDKEDKKEKKKKKKKKKRKRKKKGKGQQGWRPNRPPLLVESAGADGLFNQLKKYVADTVGTVLYLPPEDAPNMEPVVLSDTPPGEPPEPLPPVVHHFPVYVPLFDDDDDDSDECKGKGKKKGKKKKKKGRREGRKKKKKKKKKKGNKDDSCEASSEEDWDDDDDDDKGGDKKDGGKKKDGEKRDDLIALSELINKVDQGKLIIDPSISPTEFLSRTTTTTTESSVWREGIEKSTLAPRPGRYKVTKRPRTPRPQTARPVLINTSFDGVTANRTSHYRPRPTAPSIQVEGNIGVPIQLFTTTTERSTTPRLELTTLKHLIPRPTKRKLLYKNPNRRQGQRPRNKPMVGTIYNHQLKEEMTTPKERPKEDDEQEPASVHDHYIRNKEPPSHEKFHDNPEAMKPDDGEEEDYYRDEARDSGERKWRSPLLGLEKILPFRRKTARPQLEHGPVQISSHSEDEETKENEERKETEEVPTSHSNRNKSSSKGKKRRQRPKGHHHDHLREPQPHISASAPGPPQTTGLQAIKNFNIRNLLSKFGNSLLDKTIAYGRR